MSAPKGNTFWRMRATHGRQPDYKTPEDLWAGCCAYFEWVEETPLWEQRPFSYQGDITFATVYKMRAMTVGGLCLHLGISQQAWSEYKQRKGYGEVTTRADEIIREQKFTGAAAGLLEANIIARDLGLRDKQEQEVSGNLTLKIERVIVDPTNSDS